MCPRSVLCLGSERALAETHPGGCHTWTCGLRVSWDRPGRTGQGSCLGFLPAFTLVLLEAQRDRLELSGMKAPGVGLGKPGKDALWAPCPSYCLSVPLCVHAANPVLYNPALSQQEPNRRHNLLRSLVLLAAALGQAQ